MSQGISFFSALPFAKTQLFFNKAKQACAYATIGLSLLSAASVSAASDKELVVFGHNSYEQGNFPALVGVLDNTYTDENGNRIGTGPSIADVVSQTLYHDGVIASTSTAALFSGQGNNYAVATAASRSKDDALSALIGMPTQVGMYLSTATVDDVANNLYLFAPGQNDVLDAVGTGQFPLLSCDRFNAKQYRRVYRATRHLGGDYTGNFEGTEYERVAELMYAAITSSTSMLDQLQAAGAKDILIPNVTSPALFPILHRIATGFACDTDVLAHKANVLTKQFNAAIKRYVKRSDNSDMRIYNIQKDIKQLKKHADAYGFVDVENSCYLVDVTQPQVFVNPAVPCDDGASSYVNENTFLHYAGLTFTADADKFIARKMAANLTLMAK